MAEALAVVGVVASIAQLLDFGTTVLHRLNNYQSSSGEIAKSFHQIEMELPLLLYTIHQIQEAIDVGSVGIEIKKALLPVIKSCQEQVVALLQSILTETSSRLDDSSPEKGTKASILSAGQDGKIDFLLKNIQKHINTLTFYYSAVSSTLQPQNGSVS